jgi:hypothetical protein
VISKFGLVSEMISNLSAHPPPFHILYCNKNLLTPTPPLQLTHIEHGSLFDVVTAFLVDSL